MNNMSRNATRYGGRSVHNETSPEEQGYFNAFSGISQNINCLPKLILPIFEVNSLTWQTFWDSFETAVHSNDVITDIETQQPKGTPGR